MDLVPSKPPAPTCPECGIPLHGRRTREGTLQVCPRCQGHWDARPQTSLPPLLTQALEQRSRWTREGLCARGLHESRPPDEHCSRCPEASHRCPSCAARLFPSEPRGQPIEVCPRCPGLWMSARAWVALRQEPAPASLAVNLGAGGSIQRGPSPWPQRVAVLVGLVGSAAVSGAFEGLLHLLWSLFRGG